MISALRLCSLLLLSLSWLSGAKALTDQASVTDKWRWYPAEIIPLEQKAQFTLNRLTKEFNLSDKVYWEVKHPHTWLRLTMDPTLANTDFGQMNLSVFQARHESGLYSELLPIKATIQPNQDTPKTKELFYFTKEQSIIIAVDKSYENQIDTIAAYIGEAQSSAHSLDRAKSLQAFHLTQSSHSLLQNYTNGLPSDDSLEALTPVVLSHEYYEQQDYLKIPINGKVIVQPNDNQSILLDIRMPWSAELAINPTIRVSYLLNNDWINLDIELARDYHALWQADLCLSSCDTAWSLAALSEITIPNNAPIQFKFSSPGIVRFLAIDKNKSLLFSANEYELPQFSALAHKVAADSVSVAKTKAKQREQTTFFRTIHPIEKSDFIAAVEIEAPDLQPTQQTTRLRWDNPPEERYLKQGRGSLSFGSQSFKSDTIIRLTRLRTPEYAAWCFSAKDNRCTLAFYLPYKAQTNDKGNKKLLRLSKPNNTDYYADESVINLSLDGTFKLLVNSDNEQIFKLEYLTSQEPIISELDFTSAILSEPKAQLAKVMNQLEHSHNRVIREQVLAWNREISIKDTAFFERFPKQVAFNEQVFLTVLKQLDNVGIFEWINFDYSRETLLSRFSKPLFGLSEHQYWTSIDSIEHFIYFATHHTDNLIAAEAEKRLIELWWLKGALQNIEQYAWMKFSLSPFRYLELLVFAWFEQEKFQEASRAALLFLLAQRENIKPLYWSWLFKQDFDSLALMSSIESNQWIIYELFLTRVNQSNEMGQVNCRAQSIDNSWLVQREVIQSDRNIVHAIVNRYTQKSFNAEKYLADQIIQLEQASEHGWVFKIYPTRYHNLNQPLMLESINKTEFEKNEARENWVLAPTIKSRSLVIDSQLEDKSVSIHQPISLYIKGTNQPLSIKLLNFDGYIRIFRLEETSKNRNNWPEALKTKSKKNVAFNAHVVRKKLLDIDLDGERQCTKNDSFDWGFTEYKRANQLATPIQSNQKWVNDKVFPQIKSYLFNHPEQIAKWSQFFEWKEIDTVVNSAGYYIDESSEWHPETKEGWIKKAQLDTKIKSFAKKLTNNSTNIIDYYAVSAEKAHLEFSLYQTIASIDPDFSLTVLLNDKIILVASHKAELNTFPIQLNQGYNQLKFILKSSQSPWIFLRILSQNKQEVLLREAFQQEFLQGSKRDPIEFYVEDNSWIRILKVNAQQRVTWSDLWFDKAQKVIVPHDGGSSTRYKIFTFQSSNEQFNTRDLAETQSITEQASKSMLHDDQNPNLIASELLANNTKSSYGLGLSWQTRASFDEDSTQEKEKFYQSQFKYWSQPIDNLFTTTEFGVRKFEQRSEQSWYGKFRLDWILNEGFDFSGDMRHYQSIKTSEPDSTKLSSTYLALQSRWKYAWNHDTENRMEFMLFARDIEDSIVDPVIIDNDIYTQYKANHLNGFELSDTWLYYPWRDSRFNATVLLRSNEFGNNQLLDQAGLEFSWQQFYRGSILSASLQHRQFFKDSNRTSNRSSNRLSLNLQHDFWRSNGQRSVIDFSFKYDMKQRESEYFIGFIWNPTDGNLYDDISPMQTAFRSLRQARAAEAVELNHLKFYSYEH